MLEAISWLLMVEALGLAALPLAWWLFRALPDRGTAFAKPLALLLLGYAVWLGSALGVLRNATATAVVGLLVLATVAWVRWGRETIAWLRKNRHLLLRGEAVFLVAFTAVALLRAYNPAIAATEKPMDFAFLNAALRGTGIPPQDPWLSGYGISYYYFGYFLMALVTQLAGVPAAYGFNLALALLAGLVAAGAYGLVYNLIAGRAERSGERAPAARLALLGPLFVLLLANLEGTLEVFFNNNALPVAFWRWLGIRDLLVPQQGPFWYPSDPPSTWWWWRASRVVGDFNLTTGAARDYTINEFPFFSFLLGDLHPHVMALPFGLLALALALAVLREREIITLAWVRRNPARAAIYVVCFGALGFLNSWDLPTFFLVLVLCLALQRALAGGQSPLALLRQVVGLGAAAGALCLIVYLPFYIGFQSQVAGVALVDVRTKLQHLAVFWGPLLALTGVYPVALWAGGASRAGVRRALPWLGAAAVALLGFVLLDAASLGVLLLLAVPAVIVLWRTIAHAGREGKTTGGAAWPWAPEDLFVLVLVAGGILLIAACEVVRLRDGFGNRMNTVFKLYYQAWLLLAVGAAYTIYYLGLRRRIAGWHGLSFMGYRLWQGGVAVLVACGLVYTVLAPLSKANHFAGPPTLDGLAWLQTANPSEREAIAWLASQPGAPVLLEASGDEYSQFNQGSAFTGLPAVLGWAGHEYQWRGSTPEPAQRKTDVDTIYQTTDAGLAERLLRRYDVTYVYVGDNERQTYAGAPAGALTKFARFMDVAYHNDRVTIYRLRADG